MKTLKQVVAKAKRKGACASSLYTLSKCDSWEDVIEHELLHMWACWAIQNDVMPECFAPYCIEYVRLHADARSRYYREVDRRDMTRDDDPAFGVYMKAITAAMTKLRTELRLELAKQRSSEGIRAFICKLFLPFK